MVETDYFDEQIWKDLLLTFDGIKINTIDKLYFPSNSSPVEDSILRKRLSSIAYNNLQLKLKITQEAFENARNEFTKLSEQIFISTVDGLSELEGEAYMIAKTLYLSKLAYFHYRNKDFDSVDECTNCVLQIDDSLIDIYPSFYGHKLHMLQNLSRSLAVRGKYEDAAILVVNIMHHIVNPSVLPYNQGEWKGAEVLLQDKVKIVLQLESMLFELCRDVLRFPSLAQEVAYFSHAFLKNLKELRENDLIYKLAYDCINILKLMFNMDNIRLCMLEVDRFLKEYPMRYDFFKVLLLKHLFIALYALNRDYECKQISDFVEKHYHLKLYTNLRKA